MTTELWDILFDRYDPADEPRREALLALGNGAMLTRAALPTAALDGHGYPGTYRAGLYDRRDEVVDGQLLEHDVLANLSDWLPLAVRVQGEAEWLSPHTAELLQYRHGLDTRRGLSCRDMLLRDRQGRRIWLRERRLVSMARPRLGALRLEVQPVGWDGTLEIRSALDGRVRNANWPQEMPGARPLLADVEAAVAENALLLRARLLRSGLPLAVAARTTVGEIALLARHPVTLDDGVGELIACRGVDGQIITVQKVAAYCTARDPASFEPGEAALDTVREAPDVAGLLDEHELAWERSWERCRLHAGSPTLQRALRLHVFHILQTVSPHTIDLDAGFPARGWQEAYSGHVFWDQAFAFPVLTLRLPAVARGLLLYRFRRLGKARHAARQAGLRGAMFPWRSASTGREETPALQPNPLTGRWSPDNTRLARHVSLTIARDIRTYVLATSDLEFLALYGMEMLVDIARFWTSLAQPTTDRRYDIEGVTGPDEFHMALPGAAAPGFSTNAYTNVFAAWVLARMPELLNMLPRARRDVLCRALRLQPDEIGHWDRLSRSLAVVFHQDGIISQFRGYDSLQPIDRAQLARSHPHQRADLALQAEGRDANAFHLAKQPDVLMLPYILPGTQLQDMLGHMGYPVTHDQLARTARYYLDRTVHDSSLSRVACAGALAGVDPGASWQLYADAVRLDLDPATVCGAAEGVHLGAMVATLDVIQRIYLGLDVGADGLTLAPNLPPELPPIEMRLFHCGSALDLQWEGSRLRLRSDAANTSVTSIHYQNQVVALRPGSAEAFDPA